MTKSANDAKFSFLVEVSLQSIYHQYDPDSPKLTRLERRVAKESLKDHIKDAIEHWGGQQWPLHIFFPSNIVNVRIKEVPKQLKKRKPANV